MSSRRHDAHQPVRSSSQLHLQFTGLHPEIPVRHLRQTLSPHQQHETSPTEMYRTDRLQYQGRISLQPENDLRQVGRTRHTRPRPCLPLVRRLQFRSHARPHPRIQFGQTDVNSTTRAHLRLCLQQRRWIHGATLYRRTRRRNARA